MNIEQLHENLKYINHTIFMHNVGNVFTIEL